MSSHLPHQRSTAIVIVLQIVPCPLPGALALSPDAAEILPHHQRNVSSHLPLLLHGGLIEVVLGTTIGTAGTTPRHAVWPVQPTCQGKPCRLL